MQVVKGYQNKTYSAGGDINNSVKYIFKTKQKFVFIYIMLAANFVILLICLILHFLKLNELQHIEQKLSLIQEIVIK